MEIGIAQAIISLAPTASWVLTGNDYSSLEWKDSVIPKPTEAQITAEINSLNASYESNAYQRHREAAYPSVTEQLDMLWHMMDKNTIPGKGSDWYNTIMNVKKQYPKTN